MALLAILSILNLAYLNRLVYSPLQSLPKKVNSVLIVQPKKYEVKYYDRNKQITSNMGETFNSICRDTFVLEPSVE